MSLIVLNSIFWFKVICAKLFGLMVNKITALQIFRGKYGSRIMRANCDGAIAKFW